MTEQQEPGEFYPKEIRVLTASRILKIVWGNDTNSAYDFSVLRTHCRCAECKNAMQRSGRETLDTDPAITITEVHAVGSYALQLFFSDGHDRGIFPFAYLRELATTRSTATESEGCAERSRG